MPLECPLVPRISEPRERMREYERPMPPACFDSRATWW